MATLAAVLVSLVSASSTPGREPIAPWCQGCSVTVTLGDVARFVPAAAFRARAAGAGLTTRGHVAGLARIVLVPDGRGWRATVHLHRTGAGRPTTATRATITVLDAAGRHVAPLHASRGGHMYQTRPDEDGDGDGVTPAAGDCDDTRADVRPDVADVPGDGVDGDCSGRDVTGVVGSTPAAAATGVPVDAATVFHFSAPLNPSTVGAARASATFGIVPLQAEVRAGPDDRSVSIVYRALLPPLARVDVSLDTHGLRDAAGDAVGVARSADGVTAIWFATGSAISEADAGPTCDGNGQWQGFFMGYHFTLTLTEPGDGALTGTLLVDGAGTYPFDGQVLGMCLAGTIRSTPFGDVSGHGGFADDCGSFYFVPSENSGTILATRL